MSEIFASVVRDYMPHGMCLLWDPWLLGLHVASDLVIATAYFSIPIALGYFAYRRRDLQFRWLFVLFGVFIMSCGTTHILGVWILWHPAYWLDGLIKAITALTSLVTAIILWPLIPRALALPSPADLAQANTKLKEEINERKIIETALRKSEQRLRLLLDSVGEGIFGVDQVGQVTFVNPMAMRMLKRSEEEIIGYHSHGLFHRLHANGSFYSPEDCPVHAALMDGEARGVNGEVFWLPDGSNFPVEYVSNPIKDGDVVLGAVVVFRDISERLAIEQSLRRERDFTKAVIDGLPGVFYVVTPEGLFDLWNSELETVTGYSAEEIGGMSPLDFFRNEEKTLIAGAIAQVFAEGVRNVEASLVTKRGSALAYYFTGRRLGGGGILPGWLVWVLISQNGVN
ncbi:membrane hypothetical protein [Gammaproteobacteria bacterium]